MLDHEEQFLFKEEILHLANAMAEPGTLDNVEDFLATALADRSFTIDGKRVLLSSLAAGGVLLFAGTGLTVLLAVLFNLVSELTGGVRVAVVELETATPVAESSDDGGDVDGSSSPDDGG